MGTELVEVLIAQGSKSKKKLKIKNQNQSKKMKKILTTLTLFIALCLSAFGQDDYYYFGNDVSGPDFNMTMASIIYVDGVLQTDQTIEIAAFIDGNLRGYCKTANNYPQFPDPYNGYYYKEMIILGYTEDEGKEIVFKAYNHDTGVELSLLDESDDLVYEVNAADHGVKNPLKLYFATPIQSVAQIGTITYPTLQAAVDAAQNGDEIVLIDNVQLDAYVTIDRSVTLNLGEYNITRENGTALFVNGDVEVTINGTTGKVTGTQALFVKDGLVKINGGSFFGTSINAEAVYVINNGNVEIYGGTFDGDGSSANFVLNEYDSTRQATDITVYGGTFVGFNPENNAAEGAGTNFCAEGYAALPDLNGNYIVGTKPTATVNNLGRVIVPAGDYMVYGSGNNTADMPLSFVMEFIADQNEEDMATSPFADWYADFVITFTGIEGDSFNPEGCYLAGHYGIFGWVKIPVDGMLSAINEGERYPVMLGVGLGQNYKYICSGVEQFKCALYLTPEILEANPNINVNLELALVDNSQGESVAANALVMDERIYEVVDYDYDAIDFNTNYVARIGNTGYSTLADAVEAAEDGQTVTLLQSTQGSGIVIDKDVTINFGGFTYTFNGNPVGSNGTVSNGFQILKDNNVTLTNGTLNVLEDYSSSYYILIQNYANLTVEDMLLDGTNLDKYSTTDGDSYTLSNNSGNVNIIGNTTITANDEGNLAFAFDACKYANYPAPTVTIGDGITINGKVEYRGGQINHNIELYGVANKIFNDSDSWGTLSAPIKDATIPVATSGTHDLYRYDEVEHEWEYLDDADGQPFSTLELGHGYLYANTNEIELSFEGYFNIAEVIYPLSYTVDNTTLAGFNLIGNPFTHNISSANFMTSESATLADGFYLLSGNGEWLARPEGTEISPMESVLVKVDQPDIALTISKDAATKRNAHNSMLEIAVSNADNKDFAYVSFNDGIGLDKINHHNEESPMVFVTIDDKDYAIAMMNRDVTEIPVSFKAMKMGKYTFSAEGIDCQFSQMILVDKLTGEQTNLLLEDYTFLARTGDNPERFIIKLTMADDDDNDIENFAIIYNGEIIINNIDGSAVVTIIDVLGRPIAEYNVMESANISTATLRSGVYMIQMYDNNGVKVQKVVIE